MEEMGRACGIYGGEELHMGLWLGNLNNKIHLEDLYIDERIII